MVSETSFVLGMPTETADSIRDAVELAQHYAPDQAFFLAIAPWPYSDLYETLRPHNEVRDYRCYNLLEPVVRPTAMTLEEMAAGLSRAAMTFYQDKLSRLGELTEHKRRFLLTVLRIMAKHSYLHDEMKGVSERMPPEVRALLAELHRDAR